MAMIASQNQTDFIDAPMGTYSAVCVDIRDTGWEPDTFPQNIAKRRWTPTIQVVWLINCDMENGKPYQISKFYTLSLNDKATLRKDLEKWLQRQMTPLEVKGFDLEKMLGTYCEIELRHKYKASGEASYKKDNVTPRQEAVILKYDPRYGEFPIKEWTYERAMNKVGYTPPRFSSFAPKPPDTAWDRAVEERQARFGIGADSSNDGDAGYERDESASAGRGGTQTAIPRSGFDADGKCWCECGILANHMVRNGNDCFNCGHYNVDTRTPAKCEFKIQTPIESAAPAAAAEAPATPPAEPPVAAPVEEFDDDPFGDG